MKILTSTSKRDPEVPSTSDTPEVTQETQRRRRVRTENSGSDTGNRMVKRESGVLID